MSAGWRMREWAQLTDDERAILLGDKRLEPSVRPDAADTVDISSRSYWTQTVDHPFAIGAAVVVAFIVWKVLTGEIPV